MSGVILRSALACAAFAAAAAAAVHPSTSTARTWQTAIDAPASVAYLTSTYGISTAEAQRRLALQRDSAKIAQDLADRYPDSYAGMWLDQRRGGVLTVASTDPAAIAGATRTLPDATHITAVAATRSLKQLRATATSVADQLGAQVGEDVTIDEMANQVVITTGRHVSAGDARLPGILRAGGMVSSARPATQQKSCDPLHCTMAPMRGGIRLDISRDDGTVGGCTSGFNVRSGSSIFVLTAGHCVGSARHTHHDMATHEGHALVEEYEPLVNTAYPTDYAIMPFMPSTLGTWFNRTALRSNVNAYCPGGCDGSHDVPITGYVDYSAIQVGWIVCAAGAGYTPKPGENYVDSGAGGGYQPGLHCGTIYSKADGGIDVHICARAGDSGGPLFLEGTGQALGILTDGDPNSGPCADPNEKNFYSPISKILADANARYDGPDFSLARPFPWYLTAWHNPKLPMQ